MDFNGNRSGSFESVQEVGGVMGAFPNGMSYVGSYREDMKFLRELEKISPKAYGMMLQRKKRKRKKRGGRR